MSATVRVGFGTGVLVVHGGNTVAVTAAHVALADNAAKGPVRVWRGAAWADCSILHADAGQDLAVLSLPPALEGLGLALLEGRELFPGEEVWTSGHPRGWPTDADPVLCRGVVGGVGKQHWANLEASWGNSGGAIVSIASGDAIGIGGIALGKAGDTDDEFKRFRRKLEVSIEGHVENDAELESSAEHQAETQRVVQRGRAELEKALAGGSLEGPASERIRAKVELLELEAALGRVELQNLQMTQRIHKMLPGFTAMIADFIEQHFRTGFIRFAPAAAIRKILGLG